MDAETVRHHAGRHCDALLAGDIDRAAQDFSPELRANLGSVIGLLPLPLAEATVASVEPGGKGFVAVLRLVGESETVQLQTRWKERDGQPAIVEASHIAEQTAPTQPAEAADETTE